MGMNPMVSKNTLSTDAWDEVYTYLQTTNAISTDNIFSAMNSTLANDKGYPLVIIHPPLVSMDKLSASGSFIQSEVNMLIEVYHTSSQSVKTLKDEVVEKLLAGRKTFAGQRLMRMNMSGGDFDTWAEGKKKIHVISFDLTFFYAEE